MGKQGEEDDKNGQQQRKFRQPEWAFESLRDSSMLGARSFFNIFSKPILLLLILLAPLEFREEGKQERKRERKKRWWRRRSRRKEKKNRFRVTNVSTLHQRRDSPPLFISFSTRSPRNNTKQSNRKENIQSNLTWKMVKNISTGRRKKQVDEWERKKEENRYLKKGGSKEKKLKRDKSAGIEWVRAPVPRSRPTTNGTLLLSLN